MPLVITSAVFSQIKKVQGKSKCNQQWCAVHRAEGLYFALFLEKYNPLERAILGMDEIKRYIFACSYRKMVKRYEKEAHCLLFCWREIC